jgi:site-specific DNA-methyltransferase (adenine-specific)
MTVSLFHGDCLEIMPTLADGSIDLIIADIPYGEVNRKSSGLRNLDKSIADIETFTPKFVIEQSSRLAKSIYIWCGTEQVSELRGGFVRRKMSTRLGIWEKTNPSPMNGQSLWLSALECCVFARKPKAYFSEHCKSSVWRGPIVKGKLHPTQKPLWLMERLIRASCPTGGIVLDFCMGSGTTGLACLNTGRNFIGIEKDEAYFNVAKARIEQAQPTLLEAAIS